MNIDFTFRAAELLVVIGTAYKVVRVSDRVMSVLSDFPPHKHVNGHIFYPRGYEPTRMEEMK